jgi:class 3 adenylate cyclase/tetratricopeptide (TPR) repeat protein
MTIERGLEANRSCASCSATLNAGFRFCPHCGQAIDAASAEGERRQLTVLFCDLENSTSLASRLDPEDLHDLYTSYGRVCQDAIHAFQGYVAQFLGDGVLCYFGYPVAHEDDPVRAVRAALRIIEELRFVNQGIGKRLQAELHVRVGIHTGRTMVGGSSRGSHDRLAVGETPNMAARTQALAEVDTVLITGATARLVEGYFELEKQKPQIFRGFTRSVELYRVERPTGARTKLEAAARGKLTAYVGREQETDTLERAWRAVRDGADGVALIRGEAGIGKSRLMDRFRRSVIAQGAQIIECFCSPLAEATALAPIVEFLQARVAERVEGRQTPEARLDALSNLLGEHSRFGSDALALVANLLSLPGADESPIADMSPPRRRVRTLEILRAWLAWSAERVPLVFLIEDLHWADPSTLALLDLIVREPPGGRTLLCVTARPELTSRWVHPQLTTVELPRFTGAEIEAMVMNVAEGRALPPSVVGGIGEQSEGVPLYVEEVTKAVLESGALRLRGESYELVGSFEERFLPSTVEGSLVARFDRLGQSRSIAQLGAAMGRSFDYSLMRAVALLDDEALREHLDRLSLSQLVFVRGEPPNATYTFKHALIEKAIYETLLNAERARVHERILRAMRVEFPERLADRPEIEAYHAERAGQREAAVPLLLKAGQKALDRMAVAEAVQHLARGIDLVGVLEEPARTDVEIELQAAIGPAYMATVGWAAIEVEVATRRLRDLATAKGDGPRVYQAAWSEWTRCFLRAQLAEGLPVAREVHGMAEHVGAPLLRVTGHHALGYTLFYMGEYARALDHARLGLALFDLEQEREIAAKFQLSSSCALLCFQAQAELVLGNTERADASFSRWRQLMEDLRHPPSRAYSLVQQCHYCFAKGDAQETLELAAEGLALSILEGFYLWQPIMAMFTEWAKVRLGGDATAAVEVFKRSKAFVDGTGTHITELDFTSMYAEVLLAAGRPTEVFAVAESALAITKPGRVVHMEPELLRLLGDAARALGETDRARGYYQSGLELSRSLGAPVLTARLEASLGQSANRS